MIDQVAAALRGRGQEQEEARYITIGGQRVRVVVEERGLPKKLDALVKAMAAFGFSYQAEVTLLGTRKACEEAREHRLVRFREGRWWSAREFFVRGEHVDSRRRVPPGLLQLALAMCQDCGAVCVRDRSLEMWAGASPVRLVNQQTGASRIAPALGQRDVVIGWYSGARRNRREHL